MLVEKNRYLYQLVLWAMCISSWLVADQNDQDVHVDTHHYYCVASDAAHYDRLKNLIGSIHHVDYENLGAIAVFNLGLSSNQISELETMEKVSVHAVEMTHPDLLTYFVTGPTGRCVRGYFAWKPVVM